MRAVAPTADGPELELREELRGEELRGEELKELQVQVKLALQALLAFHPGPRRPRLQVLQGMLEGLVLKAWRLAHPELLPQVLA